MRIVRLLAVVGLLHAAGHADELDAAVAEAARWTEARGCASGSYRSRALPVVSEVQEAWRLEMDAIGAPPVHWDGRGYVVGRGGGAWELVAFELRTGRELARTKLEGYLGSGLFVWDDMVLVQTSAQQINGFRLERGRLKSVWAFRGDGHRHPSHPVVHDNEVYCFLGDNQLVRIRPGARVPSWTTAIRATRKSRPVVLGPFVFFAGLQGVPREANAPDDPRVHGRLVDAVTLDVYRRSNGDLVGRCMVAQVLDGGDTDPALSVAITPDTVFVGTAWRMLSTGDLASHAMLPYKVVGKLVHFSDDVGLWSYELPPAQSRKGVVVMSAADNALSWRLYRDRRFYALTDAAAQPDLFHDRVSPTVLGDICYFGSWAMDLETSEIVWRLPLARVTFPVVPADGLILVVEDGRVLRAFRGRGRR